MRLVWRLLFFAVTLMALVLVAAYALLGASLPRLDGRASLPGLSAAVTAARDSRGMVTLTAANRLDLARATGFVHAQDRYFQMDLLRRTAAGELAELFGPELLEQDRQRRLFRMRTTMSAMLAAMPDHERALLQAYTEGVNQGLHGLSARPFEYLLLGGQPRDWVPEDSLLVLATMFFGLSDSRGNRDLTLAVLREELPASMLAFLNPLGTRWDAPLIGDAQSTDAPIPSAADYDLRHFDAATFPPVADSRVRPDSLPGSNNWAVAGARVVGGGALVAGDVHLPYGVPHILYRSHFVVAGAESEVAYEVLGATIPGVPFTILGSNRKIAWSLTTTYGDWTDLVALELDPQNRRRYRTPSGWREIERIEETLPVRKQDAETLVVEQSIWGPVIRDAKGRAYAVHWLGTVPGALNMGFAGIEQAESVRQAIDIAQQSGLPPQNFTVGDRDGHIGWTVAGRIPLRHMQEGLVPESWADGAGWAGFLDRDDYPVVIDPPQGRIWTANARVVDGAALQRVGIGTYALGARARQIRDDLMAIDQARPQDMFAVQLDDRALFLQPWQTLMLQLLSPEAVRDRPLRAEARALVEAWGARADKDSVGYRLVSEWRLRVHDATFAALLAPCRQRNPDCGYGAPMFQSEAALWQLVTQQPLHLLHPGYTSWSQFLLATLDAMLEPYSKQAGGLAARSWGERNRLQMRHSLSAALPALSRYLDMPAEPQSGDANMPRVQLAQMGSAERFAVTPGREQDGYFAMPGGQSGHPLSPYYRSGHAEWMADRMSPFLPGEAQHRLRLEPAGN